jgi:PAS domain S-box-containing protein
LEVKNVVRDVTARKRAEDALRNRDLRIRQALLVRRSFAFEWNPITDEVTRSEECGPLLGLNGDEAIHDSGENFIQRVHPDDRERLVAILRELTPDSPSYIAKYRLVRPDGQVTTLEETGRGTFDVAGRLAHLTGITTDVTDREKAQAETSYLATFPSLNPNPIVEADPDGHVRFRNPAAAELFPDLPQRGKDHPWLSDWSSVSEILGEGFQHRVEREVAIGSKWYYQTLHFVPGSRSFRIYGVDITGLQEAKQALRSSEEANRKANAELEETVRKRTLELEDTVAMLKNEIVVRKKIQTQLHHLSRVFMDAADPVIIEDLSGTVVEMNREAEAVYGWGREELIGKSVDKLFLPERHQIASHLREQCCAGQEIRNHESIRKAKSGRIIPSLLTAFPLTDESGKVAFVATICKDISARKEMEARLNETQRHLKALSRKSLEALEADRRSVARELHDSIGGSLAAIKFGLEEVAGPAVQDPVCGSALLGTLIGHLADTIKETKRISANLRPLTIDDLGLLATIEWYTRQFGQRYEDIRLVRQIEVEEHEIPEDYKIVVYRIMQEALTNAAKHSKADTIHIRLKKDAGHLELEVEDNGCGFTLRKAFESGDCLSGYGLRGMQERVEICGGSISIRSRPGEGTQIKAHLPVSEILFER